MFERSGNVSGCPETSQDFQQLLKNAIFSNIFYDHTQKLSVLQKLSIKQCLNVWEVLLTLWQSSLNGTLPLISQSTLWYSSAILIYGLWFEQTNYSMVMNSCSAVQKYPLPTGFAILRRYLSNLSQNKFRNFVRDMVHIMLKCMWEKYNQQYYLVKRSESWNNTCLSLTINRVTQCMSWEASVGHINWWQ